MTMAKLYLALNILKETSKISVYVSLKFFIQRCLSGDRGDLVTL